MHKVSLAICIFLSACIPANAEMIALHGIGDPYTKSCADFLVASEGISAGTYKKGEGMLSENEMYKNWAFGFITGVNSQRAEAKNKKQIEYLSGAGIDMWLRNWCIAHPNKTFFLAVIAFLQSEGD